MFYLTIMQFKTPDKMLVGERSDECLYETIARHRESNLEPLFTLNYITNDAVIAKIVL